MVTNTFPLGVRALHPDWPEARFNVSGMFTHHPLVVEFCRILRTGLDCAAPIEALHGAPATGWNAGRVSKAALNTAELAALLESLYAAGIGCFATFSNHLIGRADLDEPVGNALLDLLAQRPDLNGVIVVSDLLSDYIARKYPAVRQIASIIKVSNEKGRGDSGYYARLGQRFHRYVVHPDDLRDPDLLDRLDRDKAEIILNENCVANCPTRVRHYDGYARVQRAQSPLEQQVVQQELNQITSACRSPFHGHRVANHEQSCNLARPEVKAIYDMGFRRFKLQGRADDPWSLAYDLTRFTLEPDYAAPLVYKVLCRWLNRAVVKVRG